jgi:hypothetical protein
MSLSAAAVCMVGKLQPASVIASLPRSEKVHACAVVGVGVHLVFAVVGVCWLAGGTAWLCPPR